MLMAPGPSSWMAGATESRLPVDADRIFDPELHLRAAVSSDEVHRAVRLQARESNASSSSHSKQESASSLSKHGAEASSHTWTLSSQTRAGAASPPQSARARRWRER